MSYHLPDSAKVIIRAFGVKYPELRKGSDDDRRTFTMKCARQIRLACGPNYGTKRADPGRPPSKDSIAFKSPGGLVSWDIINGTSREVIVDSDAEEIPTQTFIDVEPFDELGIAAPPPDNEHIPGDSTPGASVLDQNLDQHDTPGSAGRALLDGDRRGAVVPETAAALAQVTESQFQELLTAVKKGGAGMGGGVDLEELRTLIQEELKKFEFPNFKGSSKYLGDFTLSPMKKAS